MAMNNKLTLYRWMPLILVAIMVLSSVSLLSENTTELSNEILVENTDARQSPEDQLVAECEGITFEDMFVYTHALFDITINDELRNEGIAREVVSKIQNLRKSEGFEVTDRINLIFNGDEEIQNAINKNLDYVKSETLSNIIQFNVESSGGIDIIFDKLKTKIFITKV